MALSNLIPKGSSVELRPPYQLFITVDWDTGDVLMQNAGPCEVTVSPPWAALPATLRYGDKIEWFNVDRRWFSGFSSAKK